jgi:hypothetical protein
MLSKPIVDKFTGIQLTPSPEGALCLGNGRNGVECCCDNCDYFCYCYPTEEKKDT